jgi:hypothetical protein
MDNLRQLKLTNGEEIVCEVVGPDVIKFPLKILMVDDPSIGYRYFTFRPWMTYLDNPDVEVFLNYDHVISEVIPSESLIEQYKSSLNNLTTTQSVDDLRSKIEERMKAAAMMMHMNVDSDMFH